MKSHGFLGGSSCLRKTCGGASVSAAEAAECSRSVHTFICLFVHSSFISAYTYVHTYTYIYIYIYAYTDLDIDVDV